MIVSGINKERQGTYKKRNQGPIVRDTLAPAAATGDPPPTLLCAMLDVEST